MVTFIAAQFGRTLSRFDGTAPHAISPLYAAAIIIAVLNVLLYIQKHGREIYTFKEIVVENAKKVERAGGACSLHGCPAVRSLRHRATFRIAFSAVIESSGSGRT
jgi:hypothetical protein